MMDFLNNIWVILSTPNQMLIKILSIPMIIFLEMPISLYIITSIFNFSPTKKEKLLYIGISSIVSLLSGFIIPSPFNIIFNYLSSFIIVHFIFKTNAIKTIIASILPSIVFSIVQSLVFNPYITLLGITYDKVLTIPIYKFPITFFMYILIFIITYIIKNKKLGLTILDEFDKKFSRVIIFYLIFGLIYIILEILITAQYLDMLPLTYTFSNFIMLLLYFGISIYCISKVVTLTNITKKLESAEEYNKTLHILHDNVRCFKHDYDNTVTTIGGYINTNDMEGLKKYYVQLQHDCERVNNLYILNPNSINNPRYLQFINF